jgi:hypothetical protein
VNPKLFVLASSVAEFKEWCWSSSVDERNARFVTLDGENVRGLHLYPFQIIETRGAYLRRDYQNAKDALLEAMIPTGHAVPKRTARPDPKENA